MKIKDIIIGSKVIASNDGNASSSKWVAERAMKKRETGIVVEIDDYNRCIKIIATSDAKILSRDVQYIELVKEVINNTYQIY